MIDIQDLLSASILKLDRWITKNGWAGYDPYDMQCSFFLHKHTQRHNKIKYLHAYLFNNFNRFIPILSRKFFGVKPTINAKGMGLFTSAYSILYSITNNIEYLAKAKIAAQWLLENTNKNYTDYCWGYPFDWQTIIFLPEGTPSGVVTSHVGHGFWDLYKITNEVIYLDVCKSICSFFIKSLNKTENNNGICFSYTPLDDFQVHNANLFVAEFLIRVGTETNQKEWVTTGLKALNFTLAEQNDNGSICYWSKQRQKELNIPCKSDHYHSGFEIRMLYNIWKITKNHELKKAVEKYYNYYQKNFFALDYAPLLTPKGNYDIEVHACAEALLLNASLLTEFPNSKEILTNTAFWIIQNMQKKEGWFRYKLRKKGQKIIVIDVPYIRWGQAWILLGLSKALQAFKFANG